MNTASEHDVNLEIPELGPYLGRLVAPPVIETGQRHWIPLEDIRYELVTEVFVRSGEAREWCAAALEELGPPPATQIAELTRMARDNSLDTAYWAITLLGRSGAGAARAVSTLTGLLQTAPDSSLRERAAWALGKLGTAAEPAAPALRAAAASNEPRLSRMAKQALDEIVD